MSSTEKAEKSANDSESELQEGSFTFECENGSCKRKFHSDKIKSRVSFLSCVQSCSNYAKVWPKVKTAHVERSTKNFKLSAIQFLVRTPFEAVRNLLDEAVNIFLVDLVKIKNNLKESDAINGSLTISIDVTDSDEISLTMDTDECYSLSISVGIDIISILSHRK